MEYSKIQFRRPALIYLKSHKWLLVALSLGLTIRLCWVMGFGPKEGQQVDEGVFHTIGSVIANHGVFGFKQADGSIQPTGYEPPVWPYVLGAVYRVTKPNIKFGRILTACLGTILILIVYLLGQEISGTMSGIMAAWLVSLHPILIYWSGIAMTEIPFALVCCLGLWLELSRRPGFTWNLTSGFVWGIAGLMRTTALPVGVLLGLLRVFKVFKSNYWRAFLGFFTGFMFLLILWATRNYCVMGRFGLDFHGGYTTLIGIVYQKENIVDTAFAAHTLKQEPWYKETLNLNEVEKDRFFWKKTVEFIRSNPLLFLKQAWWNWRQFWRLYPRQDHPMPYHTRLMFWVSIIVELPLLVLTIIGLWIQRKSWPDLLSLFAFVFVITAIHTFTLAQMRYRIPVTPIMAVFSGIALASLMRFKSTLQE